MLHELQTDPRAPSFAEQQTLARWSGWGAVPAVFDPNAASHEKFEWARAELSQLLSAEEYAAAARSTINAHYTDAAYVQAIWDAVAQLGFHGGSVLEPGCGSGNFIGLAPQNAQIVGVELDPLTARIAAALHPHAQIRNESFADTPVPEGAFDLVIGNVPFGDLTLHDRRHNPSGRHRIHNHFLIKSLHLTRPGGLVALLTSRYTMDAANPAARREFATLADLVGAVRLPSGAHRRAAGTDVVTDLLILRRREHDRAPSGPAFECSHAFEPENTLGELRINEYFSDHANHVLGELRLTQGDRGRAELGVVGERAAAAPLAAALEDIVARARAADLVMTARREPETARQVALVSAASNRPDGHLTAGSDGTFSRIEAGREMPYRPRASQANELRGLLELRDTVIALLEKESASIDDDVPLDELRRALNDQYDRYVSQYGPINRFTERRTGRIDPETSQEKMARVRPPQGGFQADPFSNVVYALEHFDAATQTATKATIFRERVVARSVARLGADTPDDALAICLDSVGEARLDVIARLLGVDLAEARSRLEGLVFDEPGSNRLVPAAEYLSGNVRTKLAAAKQAFAEDPRFGANITALTRVLPRDLGADEIQATLGAAWIEADYVQQFLSELLEDPTVRVEHPGGALWAVRSLRSESVLATNGWGTERCSAIAIAQALLEQRQIRLYDERADGERVFNATETVAAIEKATEMAERFSEWVWEQPERAAALARTYNERFNAIVPRSYDNHVLSLPGLALSFKPRPHQIAAVARIVHEPAVGLFHDVGFGKTAAMVLGAMELRRLGLAAKPVVVVPNHMLEQFGREWLQLYPQAKLLAAAKDDLSRDRRRLFIAKCATGDWDAVIMTRSAFERIPMSLEAQRDYVAREVEAIGAMLERTRGAGERFTIKRLERLKLQAEERLKSRLDGEKDPGITFEMLGIDYVFADEAHAYKNLRTSSNIPGMAVDGSKRASDLDMKLEYLRRTRSRVGTLATATPIANSMGEVYTMQRYLRPDLLEASGITDFDQWAATFGKTTAAIEVTPDGNGMRMQTRFATFHNVPELLQQWQVSADIKTAEELQLPVPSLATRSSDGQRAPEIVVVAPSEELKEYVATLALRAERVRGRGVDPTVDNLLKISSDGRAAGLDLRLVDSTCTELQKVDVAAERVAAIYREYRGRVYPGVDGNAHPIPGSLQLVFADLGTPKPGEWSVYEELRRRLIEKGLPREVVRFVHEAKNDREKGQLFAACREGRVGVLIGSTERMGVGTNVQLRAVALHHLDCPWRPADIAQREGRILRQGNANAEVQILRYVTEGSFDAYLWQTVSRKAKFIAQVMRGRLDVREIEDIGETALSYNEVKAIAAGNPLLLEQAQTQAEVTRLERLQRSHSRNQDLLRWTVRDAGTRTEALRQRVQAAEEAIARRTESFELFVGDRVYAKELRADGNDALRQQLMRFAALPHSEGDRSVRHGSLQGFAIISTPHWLARGVTLSLAGVPGSEMSLSAEEIRKAALITRLENRLTNLPQVREADLREIERFSAEARRASGELGKPFRHHEQLTAARERLKQLDEQIRVYAAPPPVRVPVPPTSDRNLARQSTATRWIIAPEEMDRVEFAQYQKELEDKPGSEEERVTRGRWLAAQWATRLAAQRSEVARRARALEDRLSRSAQELRERIRSETVPPKPGFIAGVLGAQAAYEAAVGDWSKAQQSLHRRERCLERRLERVREYTRDGATEHPSACSRLAERNLASREPELHRDVQEFRRWSMVREREARQDSRRTRTRQRR